MHSRRVILHSRRAAAAAARDGAAVYLRSIWSRLTVLSLRRIRPPPLPCPAGMESPPAVTPASGRACFSSSLLSRRKNERWTMAAATSLADMW